MIRKIREWRKEEAGAITVLTAVAMTMMLGCAALAVDLGSAYNRRVKLQTAVDQAVAAAGHLLPVAGNVAGQQTVKNQVESLLADNGFSSPSISLDYSWEGNSNCYYSLRVTAESTVQYSFAQIFGIEDGQVNATAKVTVKPIGSSRQTVGIYIEKANFETQMAGGLTNGKAFTITFNGDSKSTTKTTDYGNMIVATEYEQAHPELYGTNPGHLNRFFLLNGYYSILPDGTVKGLAVGDERPIASTSNYSNQGWQSLRTRTEMCQSTCGNSCSFSNHAHNCPRIMVIPVVTVKDRNEDVNNCAGTAVVEYFVAMYMKSYTKHGNYCTVDACYIDDYWGDEEAVDTLPSTINRYTVCSSLFEE